MGNQTAYEEYTEQTSMTFVDQIKTSIRNLVFQAKSDTVYKTYPPFHVYTSILFPF